MSLVATNPMRNLTLNQANPRMCLHLLATVLRKLQRQTRDLRLVHVSGSGLQRPRVLLPVPLALPQKLHQQQPLQLPELYLQMVDHGGRGCTIQTRFIIRCAVQTGSPPFPQQSGQLLRAPHTCQLQRFCTQRQHHRGILQHRAPGCGCTQHPQPLGVHAPPVLSGSSLHLQEMGKMLCQSGLHLVKARGQLHHHPGSTARRNLHSFRSLISMKMRGRHLFRRRMDLRFLAWIVVTKVTLAKVKVAHSRKTLQSQHWTRRVHGSRQR